MSGHRNRLDIRMGIKIDLISVVGSKFTWFLCAESKLTWFLEWGSILTWFLEWAGNDLFLVGDRLT